MRMSALGIGLLVATAVLVGGPKVHAQSPPVADEQPKIVEVKPGDYLAKIANEHQTTYVRLFNANDNIKHPDLIYPGDKIRVPGEEEELPDRLGQTASLVAEPPAPVTVKKAKPVAKAKAQRGPAPAVSVADGSVWDRLARCESSGNWSINTGNGYFGGLQFNLGTWRSNGGSGYPHQASREEQIRVAENLRAARGFQPWPACSAKLGLR